MYTKEVENLKITQILKLTEATIENNLRLYLSVIVMLAVTSRLAEIFAGDNQYLFLVLLLATGIINITIMISTLKRIKVDKLNNTLIASKMKKGSVVKQSLMFLAFYIVTCTVLGIIIALASVVYSLLIMAVPSLNQLLYLVMLVVGIPLGIAFSALTSGIIIEIFAKNEIHHFISNAYRNVFKSKTKTFSKILFGMVLFMLISRLIMVPILLPKTNLLGEVVTSILSGCLMVVGWTYSFIVYMTSVTEKDLINVDENQNLNQNQNANQNNQNNFNNKNNTTNSEEVTRLW